MLRQLSGSLAVSTRGPGLTDISRDVETFVSNAKITEGLLTLFLRHTSASLLIQENADPEVRDDFERFFAIWKISFCASSRAIKNFIAIRRKALTTCRRISDQR